MTDAYHYEALRKARILQRKHEALARLVRVRLQDAKIKDSIKALKDSDKMASVCVPTIGRAELVTKFRVNDEGHRNRYRHHDNVSSHSDQIYSVVYPCPDNEAYSGDTNRVRRRQNLAEDRYAARNVVNGTTRGIPNGAFADDGCI